MAPTDSALESILGPEGRLAKGLEAFEVRRSQIEMARLISKAIELGVCAVVEAGTGTGKTFGYLVPIMLSGKKAVISTGTKNLQEQIFLKDIPLLCDLTGWDIDTVMMKGRKNYLCLYKYHQLSLQPSLVEDHLQLLIKKLAPWIEQTEFADRSEIPWLREDDPIWDSLTCSSDQCLGSECMFFDECFLNKLRKRAAASKIIIVNHHLFFADLKVRKTGFAEIIPRFEVALFDEAHDVEEIAVNYFGETFSTRQLSDFAGDVEKEAGVLDKKSQNSLKKALDTLRAGAEQLRMAFHGREEKGTVDHHLLPVMRETMGRNILKALKAAGALLDQFRSESLVFPGLAVRAESLAEKVDEILKDRDDNWLIWFEQRKRALAIHVSPLDISRHMKEYLFDNVKTVILTSATISTSGTFDYIRSRLGLSGHVLEGIYPSHFDFPHQALMYIPKNLPLPGEPEFPLAAAQRISQLLEITQGKALVLFTSYQNMNMIFRALEGRLPFAMLRQGDAPKSELLKEFKKDVHSVLFATGAFWQGVDVPGESLSCLIIDKLPFDSPGNPLVAARIKAIKARGGNPFLEYQVPSAIISLRQGLGRLIRKKSDRGVMAVLDKRLLTHRYGKLFINSLPPIPITHDLADIKRFFAKTAHCRNSLNALGESCRGSGPNSLITHSLIGG